MNKQADQFSKAAQSYPPGYWPEEYFRNDLPRVIKTSAEWKLALSPEQYSVLRLKRSEKPAIGQQLYMDQEGTYHCVGCGLAIFHSHARYDAGTGWLSFWKPVSATNISIRRRFPYFRKAVFCVRCDGHLGNVFRDGPAPTRLRFCMNSVALLFQPVSSDHSKS